jgi:DNA invertase Pin-like site-specific DNA recombinase
MNCLLYARVSTDKQAQNKVLNFERRDVEVI